MFNVTLYRSLCYVPVVCGCGSLLLMYVESGGPSYEIPIVAKVVVSSNQVASTPFNILSKKQFMSFGGVRLNDTK